MRRLRHRGFCLSACSRGGWLQGRLEMGKSQLYGGVRFFLSTLKRTKLRDASDTFGLQKAKPSALSTFGGGTESQKLQMTMGMKVLTALKTLARALP